MTTDPIIGLFSIVFRRVILFILLSASLACGLWCWLLISRFDVPARDLIDWVRVAWAPTDSKVPSVFLWGVLIISALTIHAAQGQTAERILIEADTKSVTANESAFYVAISRARSEATIYTDDKELLPDAMGREDIKHAALDVQRTSSENELER